MEHGSRSTVQRMRRLPRSTYAFFLAVSLPAAAAAQYVEIVKLVPADLRATDFFGKHLALSVDRLAVASEDWNGGTGAVYLYERHEGGSNAWGMTAKLLDPTPESGEHFGYSVDLDGHTLAVGRLSDITDSIYVFELTSWDRWKLSAEINDRIYGQNSISGDTIIGGNSDDHRVYVYERNSGGPGNWGPVAVLKASDGEPERFGQTLAIDGGVIVAGAYSDNELASDAGSAYVFEWDEAGQWQELEVAKLFASDGAEGDEFGRSVAVEEDLIAVGAGYADAPLGNSGAVYLYRRDGAGRWPEIAKLVAEDADVGDAAGYSAVAISQGRVIVGALNREAGKLSRVGAAFVFEESASGVWHHATTLRAADEEENDEFGRWVAASGGSVAVSAPLDGYPISKGAAYVFQRVATPAIELSGACPGEVTFTVSGATPSGAVAIAGAAREGLTDPPGEVCPDAELGLEEARLMRRLVVDSDGRAELTSQVNPESCGWLLQAVDAVTCGVGGLAKLPE